MNIQKILMLWFLLISTTSFTQDFMNEVERGNAMETANIGISTKNREAVGKILNALLDNEFVLYVKTLNYHWNVRGIIFMIFMQCLKSNMNNF